MRKEVSVLKEVFVQKSLVDRLRELLLKNRAEWPLTDLYLANPVLKSRQCTTVFGQFVLDFIEGKSREEIRGFVNGAVSTILTYLLAGGEKDSKLVKDTVKWVKHQRLKDGGWHWKPTNLVSTDAKSEAWISAGVLATLKKTDAADESYINSILKFLKRDWERTEWRGNPEVTLVYVGAAGLDKNNSMVEKAVKLLEASQLLNGAWSGYSAGTTKGGIFRTCVVLNGLTSVGLGLGDSSVVKGFRFAQSKLNEILNAKWGGVLIQGLYSLANALIQVNLID